MVSGEGVDNACAGGELVSSTNRGGQRSEADNYPTPPWVIHRFFDRLVLPTDGIWYEPCAGAGAIIQTLNTRRVYPTWWANELRKEESPTLMVSLPRNGTLSIADILDPSTPLPPKETTKVIITNPPYNIAWELMHKMLREFPAAHLALLLRVNFYASQLRHSFMSRFAPDIYVLPNRPGFKKPGKTDSPEYAWFHWGPSPRARTRGFHELLDLTSLEERKRVPDAPTVHPV